MPEVLEPSKLRRRDVLGNLFRSRMCFVNQSQKTCAQQAATCKWDPTRKKCRKRPPSDTMVEMTSVSSRSPARSDVYAGGASLDSELHRSEGSNSSTLSLGGETPRSTSVDSESPVHELHEETRGGSPSYSSSPASSARRSPAAYLHDRSSSSSASRTSFLSEQGLQWHGLPTPLVDSTDLRRPKRNADVQPHPAGRAGPHVGEAPHAPAVIRQVEAYDLNNDAAARLNSQFDLEVSDPDTFSDYCRRGNCQRGRTLRECRESSESWRDLSSVELNELDYMITAQPDYVCDQDLLKTACSQGRCKKGQTLGNCRKESRFWKALSTEQLNRLNPNIVLHPEHICTQDESKPRLRTPWTTASQLGAVGAVTAALGMSKSILPQARKTSPPQEISRDQRRQKALDLLRATRNAQVARRTDPLHIPYLQDVYSMGAVNRMKM
jgi:hypothetical protein